jgi:hypothetical protein
MCFAGEMMTPHGTNGERAQAIKLGHVRFVVVVNLNFAHRKVATCIAVMSHSRVVE